MTKETITSYIETSHAIDPLTGDSFRTYFVYKNVDGVWKKDKATATLDIAFGQIDALEISEFPRVEGTASHRGIRNGQTISFTTSW